ncbi:hypothetical protein TNCV_2621801 [Trichonephila clavipes]|uniref:Mutator-like transposase domain-containing protein n=1 Tax=Trichonephila clavipes TaxID=2585209 RepID=A0A8X7BI43_TRICX|nr:hypothetical protein TNCV_2621801 [Trichonephila clavipes]
MAEAVREAVDENDGKRDLAVAGRSVVFLRRMSCVPSLYNVRYTKYLGDGDSKAFISILENKKYGDHCSVEKLEFIGHVMMMIVSFNSARANFGQAAPNTS